MSSGTAVGPVVLGVGSAGRKLADGGVEHISDYSRDVEDSTGRLAGDALADKVSGAGEGPNREREEFHNSRNIR